MVVDTVIALTALADQDAFVSDIRFAPAGAHWAAAFSCLDVASVLAEASVRAERMARYGLSRTTPVRLHDFARSSAVLSRPQWVLACAIDGAASAQDLAWRCGLALHEAIENLGTLIAAGLCQPDTAEVASPRPLQATRSSPLQASRPVPLQATRSSPLQATPPSPPQVTPPSLLTEWFGPVPPQAALPRREHPGPVLSAPPVMAAEVSVADGMPATFEVTPRRRTCCAASWTGSAEARTLTAANEHQVKQHWSFQHHKPQGLPAPGRAQPAQWSIGPVRTGSMEHRAGCGAGSAAERPGPLQPDISGKIQ